MDSLESKVKQFLKSHSDFVYNPETNRVSCKITGHDMLPSIEHLEKHLRGNKYKLTLAYNADFTKYEQYFIIPHTKHPKKLYCTLTGMALNKIPEELDKHVEGRRFKKAFEEKKKNDEEKREKERKRLQKQIEKQKKYQDYLQKKEQMEEEDEQTEEGAVWVPEEEEMEEMEDQREGEGEEEMDYEDDSAHEYDEDELVLRKKQPVTKRSNSFQPPKDSGKKRNLEEVLKNSKSSKQNGKESHSKKSETITIRK